MLKGYKTYIVAIGMICYAVGGLLCNKVDFQTAMQTTFIALGIMGLRTGIAQSPPNNE